MEERIHCYECKWWKWRDDLAFEYTSPDIPESWIPNGLPITGPIFWCGDAERTNEPNRSTGFMGVREFPLNIKEVCAKAKRRDGLSVHGECRKRAPLGTIGSSANKHY